MALICNSYGCREVPDTDPNAQVDISASTPSKKGTGEGGDLTDRALASLGLDSSEEKPKVVDPTLATARVGAPEKPEASTYWQDVKHLGMSIYYNQPILPSLSGRPVTTEQLVTGLADESTAAWYGTRKLLNKAGRLVDAGTAAIEIETSGHDEATKQRMRDELNAKLELDYKRNLMNIEADQGLIRRNQGGLTKEDFDREAAAAAEKLLEEEKAAETNRKYWQNVHGTARSIMDDAEGALVIKDGDLASIDLKRARLAGIDNIGGTISTIEKQLAEERAKLKSITAKVGRVILTQAEKDKIAAHAGAAVLASDGDKDVTDLVALNMAIHTATEEGEKKALVNKKARARARARARAAAAKKAQEEKIKKLEEEAAREKERQRLLAQRLAEQKERNRLNKEYEDELRAEREREQRAKEAERQRRQGEAKKIKKQQEVTAGQRKALEEAELRGTYVHTPTSYSSKHPRVKYIFNEDEKRGKIVPTPDYVTFKHVPTGRVAAFTAFVTTLSDNYELAWNSEDVYGRMDPIMTYSNTKRNMSLDVEILSDRFSEGIRNMQNLNQLIQNLYPGYEASRGLGDPSLSLSSTRINAAPLLKIGWANMITSPSRKSGLLAAISSVSVTPDLDVGFFQSQVEEASAAYLIPKKITLNLSFVVLHDFTLGWNSSVPDWSRKMAGVKHPSALDPEGGFYDFPYDFRTTDKVTGEPIYGAMSVDVGKSKQMSLEGEFDEEIKMALTGKYLAQHR